MTANAAVPDIVDDRPREFRFTDDDFDFIRRLVGEQTGINLSDGKREMVYGRLARRLRGTPGVARA